MWWVSGGGARDETGSSLVSSNHSFTSLECFSKHTKYAIFHLRVNLQKNSGLILK